MCGIAGIISMNGKCVKNIEEFDHMLLLQKHRGPDDFGLCGFRLESHEFFDGKETRDIATKGKFDGFIGHNRLSILDLSEAGHQPMYTSDRKVAIVYNGEVYNAFDYKAELEKTGVRFQSATDTEVILNLYLRYGIEKLLRLLNGMFAFCIVDLHINKIYLARDRVGIKPLYYFGNTEEFLFVSEVKSLLARTGLKKAINMDAVEEYFAFRSCSQICLLDGVEQVKAGEYIEINEKNEIKKIKWFDINSYSRGNGAVSSFEHAIKSAVNRQMISDVKVGCQLSGGIDSSLVSYYAKDTGYDDAISIIFDEDAYSEKKYMDFVTDKLNIKSHQKNLDKKFFLENWEKMNWHMDTVVNHPNTLGIMALAEESKKYVTVLLSGEGADEIAGGYENHTLAFLIKSIVENKCVGSLAFKNPYYKKQIDLYRKDESEFIIQSHAITRSEFFESILLNPVSKKYRTERYERIKAYTGTLSDKMIKYDIEYYLPELLMRQDKMTMSASIENRVPLLDNKMIDYMFSLRGDNLVGWKKPHALSLRSYNFISGKKVMKKNSEKIFGKKFTHSPKRGFALPLKNFLGDEKFQCYINEQIMPSLLRRQIINGEIAIGWMENMDSFNQEKIELLWRILSFETWCQLYIDGRKVEEIG